MGLILINEVNFSYLLKWFVIFIRDDCKLSVIIRSVRFIFVLFLKWWVGWNGNEM